MIVNRGRCAVLLFALILVLPPAARAQVFLASEPHPGFAIGPLFLVANVTPQLAPLTVTVVFSLVTPPDLRATEINQDLHLLWPAEITSGTAPGPADPALAQHLEARAFTVTESGRLAVGVRDRLKIGVAGPSEPSGVTASYATFVRRDAPQQGVASYVRIPWTPRLADGLSVLSVTLPVRGLLTPKPTTWLEELFWGRRWILTMTVGDVGPPSLPLFPLYFEHRDRAVRLARDPSLMIANFADGEHLRINEIDPTAATRRMSRVRAGNEIVSLALAPSEGIVPQTLRVQFSYFSGAIAWRPVVVSAGVLLLSNLAGLFMTSTWLLDWRRRRRVTGSPAIDAFAQLVPGETTYEEVVRLCGPPDEEHAHLPPANRRTLVYRGARRLRRASASDRAGKPRAHVEEHEVTIELENDRVRDATWRVRRARPA